MQVYRISAPPTASVGVPFPVEAWAFMPNGCQKSYRFEYRVDETSHLVLLQAFGLVQTGEEIGCVGGVLVESRTIDVVVESPGLYTIRTESDPVPKVAPAPAIVSVEASQVASGSSSDHSKLGS